MTDTMAGLSPPKTTTPAISDELQNRLFGVLDYLGDLTKQGVDLAGQQIPLIARDIVMYGAVSGWVYVGIGLLLIAFSAWLIRPLCKMDDPEELDAIIHIVPAFIVLIAGIIIFGHNIDDALKATFAPRVYLIEWVAEQVRDLKR